MHRCAAYRGTGSVDGLLLSGRTISLDSTVFASARVMGVCLAVGEAAGTAAALALRHVCLPSRSPDVRRRACFSCSMAAPIPPGP